MQNIAITMLTFFLLLKLYTQLQLQLNQDLGILHQDDGSSKNKRGVLPKHATNVMRSWLFQHIGVRTERDQESKDYHVALCGLL